MNHISLFSGIGGFDLAAEWMGWENIASCDISWFANRVLNYYWPRATHHQNIYETDFTIYRNKCDILSGGFPCQPYSQSGKRLGKEDSRHLWPEMLRAIREIQPVWVVGENVYGIVNWSNGLVFEEVQSDLEAQGYKVQSYILPASSVEAPHERYRTWFVAYSDRYDDLRTKSRSNEEAQRLANVAWSENSSAGKLSRTIGTNAKTRTHSYSYRQRLQRRENFGKASRSRSQSHQQSTRFLRPNWDEFPNQSPFRWRDDGIPFELVDISLSKWIDEQIKAYGNSIVPQVAYQIFKTIKQYHETN